MTTTLNRSSDLLETNNVWSGQNYFENPPNNNKEIATTDTVVFSLATSSNTFTNSNYFLTKPPLSQSTAVSTTGYCDNLLLSVYSTNNSWGEPFFTDESNLPKQLATCKYVLSKAYLPNINNIFSDVNIFPDPTPNSTDPATTRYVQNIFLWVSNTR